MQFLFTCFTVVLSLTSILAKLHINAVCVNQAGPNQEYDNDATVSACGMYSRRHKGSDWWNTCPDCKVVTPNTTLGTPTPFCNSAAGHIGGDEMEYYCKLSGAQGSLAS